MRNTGNRRSLIGRAAIDLGGEIDMKTANKQSKTRHYRPGFSVIRKSTTMSLRE